MKRLDVTCTTTLRMTKADAVKLMQVYNPSEQVRFARYPERCVMGGAPTLAEVSRDYGRGIAKRWLVIELNDFNNFVGVKEDKKPSVAVMDEIAEMIINRYYFLKLSEVMLFFQGLKYGDYGEMFGLVDAVRILRAFRSFLDVRVCIIASEEQRMREEMESRERKNAISYDDYKKMCRCVG